jgi:UDP:flavonoid glycosyltransferase YjiC (YdhE family)
MKIILMVIGTRGDVEPFLAIAEQYKKEGHEVICAFPAQFKSLAEELGAGFFPFQKEFLEMLNTLEGKTALGGGESFMKRLKAYFGLYKQNKVVSFALMQQMEELLEEEQPDLVFHSLKAMYPVFWNLSNPGKVVLISPVPCVVHPVNHMAAIFLLGKNFGKRINRWSYRFTHSLSMRFAKNQLRRMGHSHITTKAMMDSLYHVPLYYTVSPYLFPPQPNWPAHVKVTGYLERVKTRNWKPSEELSLFLERHPHPLFITFGSMTNPDPIGKTDHILRLLKRHRIPAMINSAAGGLVEPKEYSREDIHFVTDIPYDWIFPQVRAVIHHGGAGTTHLALKYGRPSMIIPHIPDQHLWNRIISLAGAGPKGPSVSKVASPDFEEKLLDLISNETYQKNALELGIKLKTEGEGFTLD